MKQASTIIALFFSTITMVSATAKPQNHWEQYWQKANEIQEKLNKAPFTEIAINASELTQLSTLILPAFMKKQPVCQEYLSAALLAAPKMPAMSLEEIEKDYHADGKLPAIKDPSCYHAKDLLVHPATVAVIANRLPDTKGNRQLLAMELEEVLEHFNQVKSVALN